MQVTVLVRMDPYFTPEMLIELFTLLEIVYIA